MSFSEYQKWTRGSWTTLVAQDEPADAGILRAVASNVQHLYDEQGQTLVNLTEPLVVNSFSLTTSTFRALHIFGPFPIRLRPTSGAYRIRTRISIARSVGTGTVEVKTAISPFLETLLGYSSSAVGANQAFTVSSSSTTLAVSTPALGYLELPVETVPFSYQPSQMLDDGGNVVSSLCPQVYIGVFGRSLSGTNTARIAQLYAAEYVGL